MKNFLIIVLVFICEATLFSQVKEPSLIGDWEVICTETHSYYYNSVTDSLFYFKEFKKDIPHIIKVKQFGFKNLADFNENTKRESMNHKFIFYDNETYIRKKGDDIVSKGKCTIDYSSKKIYLGGKEKPRHIMEFYIENNLLYLKMNDYKHGINIGSKTIYLRPTKYTLKRINTD